jgi:hypothetical protein
MGLRMIPHFVLLDQKAPALMVILPFNLLQMLACHLVSISNPGGRMPAGIMHQTENNTESLDRPLKKAWHRHQGPKLSTK